jgi:calcium-translocating P-type ATPase
MQPIERSEPTSAPPANWHALEHERAAALLETRPTGLSPGEVEARLARYGFNALPESKPTSALVVLLHQVRSPLIYILVLAAVVTVIIGEYIDAAVIAAVVLLNTGIGFVQERKAEASVRSLMKLVSPVARVLRDGREKEVASRDLVPGDVVLLESGAKVPADLRLSATTALAIDESLLTGESVPAAKQAGLLEVAASVADRRNIAYTGSIVTTGRGRGYVVATGATTELGLIAEQIQDEVSAATPLQRRMNRFAKIVSVVVGLGALATFALGLAMGEQATDMFMVAVAFAVATIPEGLPVVLTITLATGVRRMAQRNAVLRRLPAVETLGSTTVIGSDKTGTLTENRMTVVELWAAGHTQRLEPDALDDAHEPVGEGSTAYPTLLAGVLANEAELYGAGDEGERQGDPTEVALLVAARRLGVSHERMREDYVSRAEIPFEPENQYSASIRVKDGRCVVFVKGAPERVLSMCDSMMTGDGVAQLDETTVLEAAASMATRGLRVLAMAYRELPDDDAPLRGHPERLCFAGLVGMLDPPRAGVAQAILGCQRAGIRVLMITGDHAATARAIGEQLGIASGDTPPLTGREMTTMSDAQLEERVKDVSVFARVAPDQKLAVVRALQRRGEVVAVTGDGVNDAPALKAAEIGVAMGRSGTDVARDAADMVLTDDNFVSIYAAVEEGRVTFDNVRKVTFFLISTGAGLMVAILATLALGWPLPFAPAQLLWLNLVTNGLLDVALAFEPGERGVLERPPRRPNEGIVSKLLWERTVLAGVVMATGTLVMFRWELEVSGSLPHAQTVALTTMVLFQIIHVGNARSEFLSVLGKSPFSNLFLFVAAAASLLVHVGALYLPATQFVLRVEPLTQWAVWAKMLAFASTIVVVMELHKLVRGRSTMMRVHRAPIS